MQRRSRKLIQTGFQLRLTLWFVGVTGLALVLQFFVLAQRMSDIGMELPNDSQVFFQYITGDLLQVFLGSLGIALSMTLLTGILVTHRVAGPIYRFTQFLEAVKRGEHPGECRIRSSDELKDFCALLNDFTAEMRARSAGGESEETRVHDPEATELTRAA